MGVVEEMTTVEEVRVGGARSSPSMSFMRCLVYLVQHDPQM